MRIRIIGDREFRGKVTRIRDHLGNLSPLYKSWGLLTLRWIQQNYREGGAKTGGWKALRPLTIQARRRKSNKPLLDTGHMRKQWNYRVKAWGVKIGNPMDIAEYHEKGTKPYTIKPKKRFLGNLFGKRQRSFLWFGVTPAQRRRGQQLGGHMQWRVKSKSYRQWPRGKTPGVFAKEVHHPGLPIRRQLPTEYEIMPELLEATNVWLRKAIRPVR